MMRAAILTISDSVAAGTLTDLSGPALQERCHQLGWQAETRASVADEAGDIGRQIEDWAANGAIDLILTTGGTGVAARDVTPEATRSVIDREIPGIPELMRAQGLQQTPFAVLSRGIAGTRARALVINLPGSPKGAVQSLDSIAHLAQHVVQLLNGHTGHGG